MRLLAMHGSLQNISLVLLLHLNLTAMATGITAQLRQPLISVLSAQTTPVMAMRCILSMGQSSSGVARVAGFIIQGLIGSLIPMVQESDDTRLRRCASGDMQQLMRE